MDLKVGDKVLISRAVSSWAIKLEHRSKAIGYIMKPEEDGAAYVQLENGDSLWIGINQIKVINM